MENKPGIFDTANKQLFILVFLLVAVLGFTQQIRVIGTIPCTDTGKLYNIQIGAFRITSNAERAASIVRNLGFTPGFEQYGNLTRVFAAGIPASGVRASLDCLEQAGFQEAIIRECLSLTRPVAPPARAGNGGNPPAVAPAASSPGSSATPPAAELRRNEVPDFSADTPEAEHVHFTEFVQSGQ
jgi:hypothetical protein